MLGAVDRSADRIADEMFGRVRPQQLSQQCLLALAAFQPERVIIRVQDDGHPVVDRSSDFISLRGQNGAGVENFPSLSFSSRPESGEAERALVFHSEEERLFSAACSLPFVEAIGRDDAAPSLEGIAEGGFLLDRLAARVNQARAYRSVLRPRGHETPFEERHLPPVGRLTHGQYVLAAARTL